MKVELFSVISDRTRPLKIEEPGMHQMSIHLLDKLAKSKMSEQFHMISLFSILYVPF